MLPENIESLPNINSSLLLGYYQGINVCLQNHLWLCTPLPKFSTSDLCASRSLRSASERCIIVHPKEAQNHFHTLFH